MSRPGVAALPEDLCLGESRCGKAREEFAFRQRPSDAAEPIIDIFPDLLGQGRLQNDLGEHGAAARLEHAVHLFHDGVLVGRKVEDAVCGH